MKIAFSSNYLNHHQEEFSINLYKNDDVEYYFIANNPFNEKRLKLGYEDINKKYDFIIRAYESDDERKKAHKIIMESDVVIFGYGDEEILKARVKEGKLTFRCAERLLKKGLWFRFFPPKMNRTYNRFTRYKKYKNFNVLCSSAYTAYDLTLSLFPLERCYKWGYYPPLKEYENVDEMISNKKINTLLWVGRFIEWKHPEVPVMLAEILKSHGYKFELHMVGTGPQEETIRELVQEKKLEDCVHVLGAMQPGKVREYMDFSEILLFSSNFKEGWGAVLNEAMNNACACVASHAIGSAPYLIENGVNGYIYENGNIDELSKIVERLIDNPENRRKISKAAYETIANVWNSKNAADNLVQLSKDLLNGAGDNNIKTGPCSKTDRFSNNWYIGE